MTSVPDVPEALVGWRAWVFGRSDGLEPELVSPIRRSVWIPGRAELAQCWESDHAPPASECGCGLYGVTAPGRMMGVKPGRGIIGCAALWGDVVEGTHGWRASHGYPRLLIADPGLGRRALARLGERYGVPVHTSEIPLPELVLLLDTVLRDEAEGLRTGAVAWPDLTAKIREQQEARARRAAEDARGTEPTARRALTRPSDTAGRIPRWRGRRWRGCRPTTREPRTSPPVTTAQPSPVPATPRRQ